MKYAAKMGSGGMIYLYIPSFIKIGPAVRKFMEGGRGIEEMHRRHDDHISPLSLFFFQQKESELIKQLLPHSQRAIH
jgi:hypothetical protein